MTRKYVNMTREEYEEQMRNTELYFRGEAPESELCPVCGEHDFFTYGAYSKSAGGFTVRSRQTCREVLDFLNSDDVFAEHLKCACCNSAIGFNSSDKIQLDEKYDNLTPEQFEKMIELYFEGERFKFITADWITKHGAMDAIRNKTDSFVSQLWEGKKAKAKRLAEE